MVDVLASLEAGQKFDLTVPGLNYTVSLPYVTLEEGRREIKIASLNLVGQISLNEDLGKLLAHKISARIPNLEQVAILTVVEKALQVTQVAARHLGIDAVAVAYNRIKPHMESLRRPTIQVGADSITSGGKYLALYERDINLICSAKKGIILVDDVVSTGGTIFGLASLVEEAARLKNIPRVPDLLGVFCVAQEGDIPPILPAPLHSLSTLPVPEIISS
jgi:adenine phosphoribosyltransferase